jgi:hypothetical protein
VCGAGLLCRNLWLFKKNGDVCRRWDHTLRGRVWMFSFVPLDGVDFIALVVGCVCGGCGDV